MPQVLDRETSRHETDTAIRVPEKTAHPEPSTTDAPKRPIRWIAWILGLVAIVMVGVFVFDVIDGTTADEPAVTSDGSGSSAGEPMAVMPRASGSSAGEPMAVMPRASGSSAGERATVTSDGSFEANELRRMLDLAPEETDN